MGARQSNSSKTLGVSRIQFLCINIKVRLQEVKRQADDTVQAKEREFIAGMRSSAMNNIPRNTTKEVHQLSSIIEKVLLSNAAQAVIQKTEVIKDYAHIINQSNGSISQIKDLQPIIENICWSNSLFGMEAITIFQTDFAAFFGQSLSQQNIQQIQSVDDRLHRALAPAIIASFDDLNLCVNDIANKYDISIEEINGDTGCCAGQQPVHVFHYNYGYNQYTNSNMYGANPHHSNDSSRLIQKNQYEQSQDIGELPLSNKKKGETNIQATTRNKSKILLCY